MDRAPRPAVEPDMTLSAPDATRTSEPGSLDIRGPTSTDDRAATPLRADGSLNVVFAGTWLLVVALCIALGMLVQGLYRLGVDARVDAVSARLGKATTSLQTRFGVYVHSFAAPPDLSDAARRRELDLLVNLVLQDYEDVEGGLYDRDAGFVAYGFPSYEGGAIKQDVPAAESARIAQVAQEALNAGSRREVRVVGARQTLIVDAAPAGAGTTGLAVWTMSRAHARTDAGSQRLLVALGVLGFVAAGSGIAFIVVLRRWNRALARVASSIETAGTRDVGGEAVAPTGRRDLDRIVRLVAALRARLDAGHVDAERMSNELARAHRVASMGRMTAQLVHEIRNPIAAMRLQAENALASGRGADVALTRILDDVDRLDDLLARLQALTRLNALRIEPVALRPWLDARMEAIADRLRDAGIASTHDAPDATWPFDAGQMARALDNLLLNAIQHAATDAGAIDVRVRVVQNERCNITVEDDGPGIDAADLERVFEPFHTTGSTGSGLGLSIAREIVEAHGGTLRALERHDAGSRGACFEIVIPWTAS